MKKIILPFLLLLSALTTHAQNTCMLLPVTMEQLEKNSPLIIEGKVISSHSYWNNDHTNIYTSNKIEVFKIVKGTPATSFIEVITEGGIVNDRARIITNTLLLTDGQYGMFFLELAPGKITTGPKTIAYRAYADMQGFFNYDLSQNTAASVFEKFNSIEHGLYLKIKSLTGKIINSIKQLPVTGNNSNKVLVTPVISSFSPSTIHAGTKEILTINGSGFGATRGTGFVEFKRANDQGATTVRPINTDYVSWTDNQIQLFVPNQGVNGSNQLTGSAGSGVIKVTNSDPSSITSSTALKIEYSVFNNPPGSLSSPTFMINLVNANNNGGYTFQKNNAFASTAASAAFDRAFNNWRCNIGINWILGSNTGADSHSNDGINVITFDNNDPLPVNVLGRGELTLDVNSTCGSTLISVIDCDIRFSATAANNAWNFTTNAPSSSQADFETVSLHELGHLVGVDHSLETCVMFPTAALGFSRRILDTEDLNAGNFMMARSTANGTCTHTAMTPFVPVNPPTISISTASQSVCSGTSVTFTATTTNGSGGTFEWKKNGLTVSTSANSFSTSSLANNDIITCELSVPGTCKVISNSLVMTIKPLPPSIGSSGPSCFTQNTPLTYTATTLVPNATYEWTFAAGVTFNGSSNTPSVSVTFPSGMTSSGVLVVPVLNGCRPPLNTTRIVFSTPAQPASLTGPVIGQCAATGVTYTAAPVTGATGFSWSATNGVTFTVAPSQESITANFPSNFTSAVISVSSLNNSCPSAPRSLTVQAISAQPASITGPTNFVFLGSSASGTFTTPAVTGATSYLWSSPSAGVTVISGQGTRTARFSTTSPGKKIICVRAVNNCGQSTQKCITVDLSFRIAEEINKNIDITVYPNPFNDVILINPENSIESKSAKIKMFDLSGKLVLEKEIHNITAETSISTVNLSKGVYVMQIISGEKIQSLKMVK